MLPQTDWSLICFDERTGLEGESRYSTERDFLRAVDECMTNYWKWFVSATLPSGKVLNDAAARDMIRARSLSS